MTACAPASDDGTSQQHLNPDNIRTTGTGPNFEISLVQWRQLDSALEVSITVANTGSEATSEFHVSAELERLSGDPELPWAWGSPSLQPALSPGEERTLYVEVVEECASGCLLWAEVDKADFTVESDEEDNRSEAVPVDTKTELSGPDVLVRNVRWTTDELNITYTVTLANEGDVTAEEASVAFNYDLTEPYQGADDWVFTDNLGPGEEVEIQHTVTRNCIDGCNTSVRADINMQEESDRHNNAYGPVEVTTPPGTPDVYVSGTAWFIDEGISTVRVANYGSANAYGVRVDVFDDLDVAPDLAAIGDRVGFIDVPALSQVVLTMPSPPDCPYGGCHSWVRVDGLDEMAEMNEDNNLYDVHL
jgi:hypothetical protein